MNNSKPQAFIAISKNRIKSYGDTVYLEDKTEFQLEFNNPTSDRYLAKISYNGKEEKSGLILRPGEHVYIDRFMDEGRKLKFDTYNVPKENYEAADKTNGKITVKFYKEQNQINFEDFNKFTPDVTPWNDNPFQPTWFAGDTGKFSGSSLSIGSSNQFSVRGDLTQNNGNEVTFTNYHSQNQGEVETGRVEKGDKSDQKFHKSFGDFEDYHSSKTYIQIKPQSHKPRTAPIRKYCSECGSKVKSKWKYCVHCGEKL